MQTSLMAKAENQACPEHYSFKIHHREMYYSWLTVEGVEI